MTNKLRDQLDPSIKVRNQNIYFTKKNLNVIQAPDTYDDDDDVGMTMTIGEVGIKR